MHTDRAPHRGWPLAAALMMLGLMVTPALAKHAPAPDPAMHFRWSGVVDAGKTLEIHGVNGPIRTTLAHGDSVVVTAVKSANHSDPADVRIEAVPNANGVLVCARYPRPSGDLNDCTGNQKVEGNDVRVSFNIELPAGVSLVVRSVNGAIEARGLKSAVDASTVNGDVRVETTREARTITVNGNIDVRLAAAALVGPLEFTTVNGDIGLELVPAIAADVDARTTNGSIHCALAVSDANWSGHRRLRGRLGGGGPRLRLETVNGSIALRAH